MKRYPILARVRTELRCLEKVKKYPERVQAFNGEIPILDHLPGRDIVEPLVQTYLETYESVYHVLHVPSFWREYHQLWEDRGIVRPGFVAIVLLMISSVQGVSANVNMTAPATRLVEHSAAVDWVAACENWLDSQSQKHLNLTYFQVSCLLFLSKRVNVIKAKRHWTSSGSLMRFAMSAGLHREPKHLFTKITPFDAEMRRRVWATIVELELQASVDRGMPSFSDIRSSDAEAPSNIFDEEMDESMQELPSSRPLTQFTGSSYLHISRKSLQLRAFLNQLINDSGPHMELAHVLHYEEKILQELQDLPKWDYRAAPDAQGILRPRMVQTLLDIQLRQVLLLLHRRSSHEAASSPQRDYSRGQSLNTAMSLIGQHHEFLTEVNAALNLLRDDVFRAALGLCYDLTCLDPRRGKHSPSMHSPLNLVDETLEKILLTNPCNTERACTLVDSALRILEDKVMRLGGGLSQFSFVCTAFGCVKAKLTPNEAHVQEELAADRMMSLYHKFLAIQANESQGHEFVNGAKELTAINRVAGDGTQDAATFEGVVPELPEAPYLDPGIEEINYADMDQWFLDDMWNF